MRYIKGQQNIPSKVKAVRLEGYISRLFAICLFEDKHLTAIDLHASPSAHGYSVHQLQTCMCLPLQLTSVPPLTPCSIGAV